MPNNLSYSISTNIQIDRKMINNWNSIKSVLKEKYLTGQQFEVHPLVAEKYKFDLYGLFKYEIHIDDLYIYPHMIVNDYDCSNNYDGGKLRFDLIKTSILETYYRLFIKK